MPEDLLESLLREAICEQRMLGFERVLEEIVRTAEGVDFRREKGESVLMAADLSVFGEARRRGDVSWGMRRFMVVHVMIARKSKRGVFKSLLNQL